MRAAGARRFRRRTRSRRTAAARAASGGSCATGARRTTTRSSTGRSGASRTRSTCASSCCSRRTRARGSSRTATAGNAGARPRPATGVAVIKGVPATLGFDLFRDERKQLVLHHVHDTGIRRGAQARRVRQVVAMRRSVRRMQIEADLRVVVVPELDECPALGRIELHEVAIDVEVLSLLPRASFR